MTVNAQHPTSNIECRIAAVGDRRLQLFVFIRACRAVALRRRVHSWLRGV
jgi:hypothetical protein